MNGPLPVTGWVEIVCMVALSIGAILGFIRLVRGPSLPDRVVALDLLPILGLGMFAIYAIATGQAVFLDVGIILALIIFITTISFAFYIEKGTLPGRRARR